MGLLNENKLKIEYDIIYNMDSGIEKNIYDLRYRYVKRKKNVKFNVDFNLIKKEDYKRIIKKFQRLINRLIKDNNYIFNIIIYIYNYDKEDIKQVWFIDAIHAIMKLNRKDMYNFIYDNVCDYLDVFFINNNVCNFENNKCGEKVNTSSDVGCCRHFKYKKFGPLLLNNKLIVCEYLKDKRCSAKCISCKLFTCEYIKKKGITFKMKDMFLIDTFFNPIQKYFIKYKVFTPKEEIMKLLLRFG